MIKKKTNRVLAREENRNIDDVCTNDTIRRACRVIFFFFFQLSGYSAAWLMALWAAGFHSSGASKPHLTSAAVGSFKRTH